MGSCRGGIACTEHRTHRHSHQAGHPTSLQSVSTKSSHPAAEHALTRDHEAFLPCLVGGSRLCFRHRCVRIRSFPDADAALPFQHVSSVQGVPVLEKKLSLPGRQARLEPRVIVRVAPVPRRRQVQRRAKRRTRHRLDRLGLDLLFLQRGEQVVKGLVLLRRLLLRDGRLDSVSNRGYPGRSHDTGIAFGLLSRLQVPPRSRRAILAPRQRSKPLVPARD